MPCVPIVTDVPSGPEPGGRASICHSTWSTPESASVPVTGDVDGAVLPADGA